MARKNRKNGHEGSRMIFWGVPGMALVALLGMVYLHLHGACESIGREIKRLEGQRADLRKQVVNEERNWEMARYIQNMQRLMDAHGIAMTFPESKNVIRLRAAEPEEPAQYAARNGAFRRD